MFSKPCNELFNTFLISGDVCDEVVFVSSMFKSPEFLSKLTSVKRRKHLCDVYAFVFFLMCGLKANPSNVPLRKQLVNEAVDPAELRRRETENGVWFGFEEAQDRIMSAMGKILLDIVTEYKENELDEQKRTGYARDSQQSCRNGNKNSNSNDVVNEVFLRRVHVPAVLLLKTSYLQLESYFNRLDVQFCVKECARRCSRSSTAEGIAHLQIFLEFFLDR